MDSWVRELAAGRTPPELLNGDGTPKTKPPASSANLPAPPRVCFGSRKEVNNPGAQFSTFDPVCGWPLRDGVGDKITVDKDLVTCPLCKMLLEDAKALTEQGHGEPLPELEESRAGDLNPALALAPGAEQGMGTPLSPAPALDPEAALTALMDVVLDVAFLEKKLRSLKGEIAAIEVLLKAARARAVNQAPARIEEVKATA